MQRHHEPIGQVVVARLSPWRAKELPVKIAAVRSPIRSYFENF
jgi:hypothetical protein